MWIFTRDGFFSVTTDKRTNGENVMVRARVRGDLENLQTVIDSQDLEFPPILESERADYRYRMIIPRLWWVGYVAQAAQDIDYTNVKGTLAPKEDPKRHTAMLKVWSAMYALQPGGRRGWDLAEWDRLPDVPDDDEDWDDDRLWEDEL